MNLLVIEDWIGGLADGDKKGLAGSFRYGKGLDFKSNPDAITAELALVKASSTNVTGMPKWIIYDGINNKVYAYCDDGKIHSSASSWTSLRTVANSSGQGLEIYNDYLYYTQNAQIGRYGSLAGSPSFTDNWQTSLDGTTSWRPLKTFMNLLLCGNGRYLATYDGSTWTAQKLTFPPGWSVRDIDVRGEYAAIAVNNSADITKATRGLIFYWDGTSSTYNFFNEVMEGGGISSIQANQDSVWCFPGNAGNIYIDTGRVSKVKRIPFVGRGKTIYVYPGADANFRGNLTFGVAGGTSTTAYRGVYEFGQPSKDYPYALNFSYPISTGTVQGTGVEIGAIHAVGPQIYVGWKDGSTYGIDLLSTSTVQTSVTYESRVLSLAKQGKFLWIKVFCEPLASGESITTKYKADKATSWTAFDAAMSYTADGAITYKLLNEELSATDFQFQLTLAGSATMPTVHKVIVAYDEEERL